MLSTERGLSVVELICGPAMPYRRDPMWYTIGCAQFVSKGVR